MFDDAYNRDYLEPSNVTRIMSQDEDLLRLHLRGPGRRGHPRPAVPGALPRPQPRPRPRPARAAAQDRQPAVHHREDHRVGAEDAVSAGPRPRPRQPRPLHLGLQLCLRGGEGGGGEGGCARPQGGALPHRPERYRHRRRGILRQALNISYKQY